MENDGKEYKFGLICALTCAVLWGAIPIYWKALEPVNSFAMIFYRIFLIGITAFLVALKLYGVKEIKAHISDKRAICRFTIAGALITSNWSIYIWAVTSGYVIQTSIGYYIEPLIVCGFGVVFFNEKLDKYKIAALSFAAIGVGSILIYFKEIPLIALSLAITFAIYAAMKKKYTLPAILTLFYETMIFIPISLIAVIYLEATGRGAIGVAEPHQFFLLAICGIITGGPLILFTMAANRIPLITLGVTEYITPTLTLIIGITLLGEPFDKYQFIAFLIIWMGLCIFTYGEIKKEGSKL